MKPVKLALPAVLVAGLLLTSCGMDTSATSGGGTGGKPAKGSKQHKAKHHKRHHEAKRVVFKVWGDAPQGVDVTYGSDSDNRDASGRQLPIKKTLKIDHGAMFYDITAQLNGGGNIHCSVRIGKSKDRGHASGSYNICDAQLNQGLIGGWD